MTLAEKPRPSRRALIVGIGVPTATLFLVAAYLVLHYFVLCGSCGERLVPIPCGDCSVPRPVPPTP